MSDGADARWAVCLSVDHRPASRMYGTGSSWLDVWRVRGGIEYRIIEYIFPMRFIRISY